MEGAHTFSLTAIIRRNKSNADGTPVYLRITCNNERVEASVKVYVDPKKWNSTKGRVKGTSEDARRLNDSIETFEHRARDIYNQQILTGKAPNACAIKNALVGNLHQPKLLKNLQEYVRTITARIGKVLENKVSHDMLRLEQRLAECNSPS